MKIVLAGGSGHLGTLLKKAFLKLGWEVVILSRQRNKKEDEVTYVFWDGEHLGAWCNALDGADTVINLSGKSIQCRFTAKNRALLDDSRILPTDVLGRCITKSNTPPRLWINFSGISIFGGLNTIQDETSSMFGTDYLARLTKRWESSFTAFDLPYTQKVILRVSPVLSTTQGMFAELLPITKWGLGGQAGGGRQYISWIHEEDFVRLVTWIISGPVENKLYHACSPFPVSNAEFMENLRYAARRAVGLPLPGLLAKIGAFIKGVDSSLILQTTPATTKFLLDEGFEFHFPYIRQAFNQLINSK